MGLRTLPGPALAERTTLRLGGRALAEISVEAPADLDGLGRALERVGGTPLALGAGSNILAREGELPLTIVSADMKDKPEVVPGAPEGKVRVRAGAGLGLPYFLSRLEKRGLWGLSGLAGIPGRLGGAVAMNAGSYGAEIADALARVRIWTPEGGLFWIGPDRFEIGYRRFAPKDAEDFFLVVEAEMDFEERTPRETGEARREALDRKKASQPVTEATAGCVFCNPPGESAGKLLDQAGFKGKRLGGMAFSEMHANFLVNTGGGRSGEALELMALAVEAVRKRFGVALRPEVKVVP